jgi:hypothetical protein
VEDKAEQRAQETAAGASWRVSDIAMRADVLRNGWYRVRSG